MSWASRLAFAEMSTRATFFRRARMTAMVEHGAGNVAHATTRELDPKEVDLKEVQYVF